MGVVVVSTGLIATPNPCISSSSMCKGYIIRLSVLTEAKALQVHIATESTKTLLYDPNTLKSKLASCVDLITEELE